MVQTIVIVILIKLVAALRGVQPNHRSNFVQSEKNILAHILNNLSLTRPERSRRINPGSLVKDKNVISKHVPKQKLINLLRQNSKNYAYEVVTHREGEKENVRNEQALLVENELIDALTKQSSALLDMPYVEKKGRNDFLVMKPDVVDPFVTVIPNAIYYNIEKKCVNWLDDCSLQGIRARLLNQVQSPY